MIQNMWRHDEVTRYRITINQILIFRKIISQQPQEVNSQFLNHCTDRCSSKNIDKKVTLIWPILPVQTVSQSWISLKNHISTTARGKFTICALLYRSLILKKIFTKRWPQFDNYFLSKPEVKVEYLKKIISQQPQEVNSQFLHHCTDR